MAGKPRAWLAALVVALTLISPGTARADDGCRLFAKWRVCPPSSYSPCQYWVPRAYTFNAYVLHPDYSYIYARDWYPGQPIENIAPVYRCPTIGPGQYPFPPGAPAVGGEIGPPPPPTPAPPPAPSDAGRPPY